MRNKAVFFIDKFRAKYIILSSLLLYIFFKHVSYDKSIYVSLVIRTYYVVASVILIILLKQIKKYNDNYIYNSTWKFFLMIILISMMYFLLDISQNMIAYSALYIDCSGDIILIYEIFLSYILSEYLLEKKHTRKLSYTILILTMGIILLTCYFKAYLLFLRIIGMFIKLILIVKMLLNLKLIEKIYKYKMNTLQICTIFVGIIEVFNIYKVFYLGTMEFSFAREIINLIIFRFAHSLFMLNLIREPYRDLSKYLAKENNELDKLNLEIIMKNNKLEKSINIINEKNNINKKLFTLMPHPIIILNAKNDRILFVNRKFKEFANIDNVRILINKKISNYIEYVSRFDEEYDFNAVFKLNGLKKYVYVNCLTCYIDEDVKILVIKDNTSKVEAGEIKREIEKKQLEEKMRTNFLSSISHDLKTPINVIYSATQVEKIYIQNNDKSNLKKYNSLSQYSCISLIEFTNNLIDASKINFKYLSVNLQNNNIVEIIEENVMSLVEYAKWNNVDLIFDTDTEECNMLFDTEFMKRIMLNLISNSVKFTPDGGKIYVTVNKKINEIEISIEDTGRGMSDDFIERAFDRYSVDNTNDINKSGTGIGLFVVKQLVEKQKGRIYIEKGRKTGTKITMIYEIRYSK